MAELADLKRFFDIELTNRCNALCTFCPREETPEQGFMAFDTFSRALDRVQELQTTPDISLTGQGEPCLHPQIVDYARHAQERGLSWSMTTNGSLMTEEMAGQLIDAGLQRIHFSVSDMDAEYEEVYALKFDVTRANILRFLDINEARGKPVATAINIVPHDLNRGKIDRYRTFWTDAGIDKIEYLKQSNRGGACDHGHHFLDSDRFRAESLQLLADNGITRLCPVPYLMVFVGWNGQYYICCNDYRKTTPLGSLSEHSVEGMDVIKRERFCSAGGIEACRNCNMDPVNEVRERFFEIESGAAQLDDLEELLRKMKKRQAALPAELASDPV